MTSNMKYEVNEGTLYLTDEIIEAIRNGATIDVTIYSEYGIKIKFTDEIELKDNINIMLSGGTYSEPDADLWWIDND